MTQQTFDEKFAISAERFKAFFNELEGFFVERGEILTQIALALLAKEHVLLTGPPGNAKSQIASLVLRRIIDEKTSKPSLYSRQFTENTVQTDLVGPINFKTLVDSGRTEHFTDEGMLGAVHAFLDEVFDGRDMLLRSTLNILQERELKEGTKTVQGQIECAIMTSNRYLAELLEGSRDTLLAFIDRIAFISFVPKGFADPQNLSLVLRRQLSGEQVHVEAPLWVQDLDVLQEAAGSVHISTEICDALGQLLLMLDAEAHAVARADPHYVPTRYLSTRTAVRAGKILRSICIFDKIFHQPNRPLEVLQKDFEPLYLHLILCGQPKAQLIKLLAQENDSRERRQLEILRTEREIFERCLARLPQINIVLKAAVPTQLLRDLKIKAQQARTTNASLEAIQKLAEVATQNLNNPEAKAALQQSLDDLPRKILQESIQTLHTELNPSLAVEKLAKLADQIESTSSQNRALARWLRGKSLSMIESLLMMSPVSTSPSGKELKFVEKPVETAIQESEKILLRLESLAQLKTKLLAKGAEEPTPNNAWDIARARVEAELGVLWDEILFMAVQEATNNNPNESLSQLFIALRPAFRQLELIGARLEAIGATQGAFKLNVVSPRLKGMLCAAFDKLDGKHKRKVLENVTILLHQLEDVKLLGIVSSQDIIDWSAKVLARGDQLAKPPEFERYNKESFALVREFYTHTNAQTLLEIGVWVFPNLAEAAKDPAKVTETLHALLNSLPEPTKEKIGQADLNSMERQIAFLEHWWAELQPKKLEQLTASESFSLLEKLVGSGLLQLLRQEAIGVRFVSTANAIASSFQDFSAEVRALCERVERLEEETAGALQQISMKRADNDWSSVLRK
jgi:MoxR-like ATPase